MAAITAARHAVSASLSIDHELRHTAEQAVWQDIDVRDSEPNDQQLAQLRALDEMQRLDRAPRHSMSLHRVTR